MYLFIYLFFKVNKNTGNYSIAVSKPNYLASIELNLQIVSLETTRLLGLNNKGILNDIY